MKVAMVKFEMALVIDVQSHYEKRHILLKEISTCTVIVPLNF